MTRNHALRPDRDAKQFQRFVWVKQHPDREPRGAEAVHGGDHDDSNRYQGFER